jgi:hypothetical protein
MAPLDRLIVNGETVVAGGALQSADSAELAAAAARASARIASA